MSLSPVLLSSPVASHSSSSRSLISNWQLAIGNWQSGRLISNFSLLIPYFLFPLSCFFSFSLSAQTDSLKIAKTDSTITDTTNNAIYFPGPTNSSSVEGQLGLIPDSERFAYTLTPAQKKRRIWLVGSGNVVAYSTAMIGLYSAWYKDYPQTNFHTFNDWPEWKQVDKVGHFYSAYVESRGSMELWRWTGIDRKKRIWLGGMSGAFYQTVIEVLDGFSEGWGWSWADFGANILGSGTLVAQELAWNDQRIKIKFSFHRKSYDDPQLNQRSDLLFGKGNAERFLKDYNGQTYWASINLKPFLHNEKFPTWLSVAIGYGAEGMFGGRENIAKDPGGTVTFNRPDIKRYRQWYLAPDIDLSKIKTKSKALNFFLTFLSAFKFPLPSIEFSNGKFKAHAIHF